MTLLDLAIAWMLAGWSGTTEWLAELTFLLLLVPVSALCGPFMWMLFFAKLEERT